MVRRVCNGWPLGALVAGVVALAVAAAGAPPAPAQRGLAARLAEGIRDCASRERVKHGLKPLTRNRYLDKAAVLHARNMARRDFFDHNDPWGRGPEDRISLFRSWESFIGVGENIAAGRDSVEATCRDWMESPDHRENILDPAFRTVGGGFAQGDTELRFYYVQTFGEANPGGGGGGARRPEPRRDAVKHPPVEMRLFNASERLTLSIDGQPHASARPGQDLKVELGRLDPRTRITVETRTSSGAWSWGIEQRRGGRQVFREVRSVGSAAREPAVTTLATSEPPRVHRVTLAPSGRVLESRHPGAPDLPPPYPFARLR